MIELLAAVGGFLAGIGILLQGIAAIRKKGK